MTPSAAPTRPLTSTSRSLRSLRLSWLGHLFPLAILLGSISLPVMGKQFVLPLYLPFLYFALLKGRMRLSLRRVSRQDLWVAAYCLAALCSAFFAQDLPKYAYGFFALFLIGMPAYLLGRRLAVSEHWSPSLLVGVLISLSVAMSLLYIWRLAMDPLGFRVAFILKLTQVAGMRSNTLVSFHVFGLVAILECLRRASLGRHQFVLLALLLVCLAGGIAFNSRAYLLLMFIPVIIYLVRGRGRGCWYLRGLAALAMVVLIARPPAGAIEAVTHRWVARTSTGAEQIPTMRIEIWRRSMNVWLERPLFGHGLNNSFLGAGFLWHMLYRRATLREIASMPEGVLNYRADGYFMAHNTLLQLLIEVGLLGAVVFLVILARSMFSLANAARTGTEESRALTRALLVGLALAFVEGMVENNFLTRDFGTFYWFLAGLAYSLYCRQMACAAREMHPGSTSGPGAVQAA